MSDYQDKIHKNGPNELVVESGGVITVNSGGSIANSGDSIAVVDPAANVADADVTLTPYSANTISGVDGTGSNAAALAGVNTELGLIETKLGELDTAIDDLQTNQNLILAALKAAGIMIDDA